MTGHVFHPGHDEWHGQTVVVFTSGPRTVVGRWDSVSGGRLFMHDCAVHDATAAATRASGGAGPAASGSDGPADPASVNPAGAEPAAADPAPPESREAWLARIQHYGIPVQHKDFALPHADVARVVRLRDV